MRFAKLALVVIVGLVLGAINANAQQTATQSVTANIAFDTPLTITKNNDITFGTVKAAQIGTYVISTAGVITASAGGVWLYGTPVAGSVTVVGSATQAITISTGSYVAQGGITLSAATCKYAATTEAACDGGLVEAAPSTGTTLLLGVQAVSDATPTAGGTATPSFTVTAVYN